MTDTRVWDARLQSRLAVLGLVLFTYLTAEMFPVGALPEIASGLDVKQSAAGLLLSVYAVVAGVSAIPVVAWTDHRDRRALLCRGMLLLAACQAAMACAPTFEVALGVRATAAVAHGLVWSVVPVVASRLAPAGSSGRATGAVFVGASLGLLLGGPLSTVLSDAFGWRAGALGVAALAGVTAIMLRLVLPPLPAERSPGRVTERSHSPWPGVGLISVVTIAMAFAHYVSYTYLAVLVAPVGIRGVGYAALLAAYGVAGLIGVRVVGGLVDRMPFATSAGLSVVLSVALAALGTVLHVRAWAVVVVAVLLVWAAAFSAAPVMLQSAVLRVAPHGADLASTVYVVAFQIGIASGSASGAALVGPLGSTGLPWVSALAAVGAAVLLTGSRHHRRLRAVWC